MNPKILSLGYALPEKSYTQSELFEMLGYKSLRVKRIFENSGIAKRHLWTNPVGKSWQELTQEYQRGSIELSKKAIIDCMDGRPLSDVGCIAYSSCTGYTCPGISQHLNKELGLSDSVRHYNMLGLGCEGASPTLSAVVDYVKLYRKPALLVACEICSAAYFPALENDLENTVVNCIFGDAAAAMLIGYDSDPYHPEIVDIQSYFNKEYLDYLGFKWVEGRLKCVLNKDVPKVSGMLVREAVYRLLGRNNLAVSDIDHWAVHPGGLRVLEEIQKALPISYQKLKASYEVLHDIGNVSSATVIIMGKQLNHVEPPAWGLGVTMGAGAECGAVLLQWRSK